MDRRPGIFAEARGGLFSKCLWAVCVHVQILPSLRLGSGSKVGVGHSSAS